jgi:hypothetical protein
MAARPTTLFAVIGDIHGRFHRVQSWLAELEGALGRPLHFALAVGDVEAFADASDHRRKAAKRAMAAEFFEYASGVRRLHRPMYFLGGNNEDFASLSAHPEGAELAPSLHYLGRVGVRTLGGVRVGFLSGIFAPKSFEAPLAPPTNAERWKQAGYFRAAEVEALARQGPIDLLALHEWPRGLVPRGSRAGARPLRAYRFPWIGNPHARRLAETLAPKWLVCGHSHAPLATSLTGPHGEATKVSCLDQAARPDASVLWLEFGDGRFLRAGWGTSGRTAWSDGEAWTDALTPDDPEAAESTMA